MKQAVKKGSTVRRPGAGLAAFKEKMGLTPKQGEVSGNSNADKPQGWILMPKAFQEATKLNGIPMGTVASIIGHSNVGKSTFINHAIASAQAQGILPVIIDTENAFSFQYAQNMGFKCEPIYGDVEVEDYDEETGEVTTHTENQIVHWDGDFLYFNNHILCEQFGGWDYAAGTYNEKKKRSIAVVEDVAMCINTILDAQENGEIMQDILFVWDSVGSIGCFKEIRSGGGGGAGGAKIANPMWVAAAISAAFNDIVNNRIPASKKISSKFTNTLLYVNKVWMDSTTVQTGPAIMQTKGGKSLHYSVRIQFLLGSQLTSGIKRLTATSKGVNYSYGIQTKIKVLKNHLNAPHNVCYEGSMIACDKGFIGLDDLDEYKKTHISQILKELNKLAEGKVEIKAEDVEFIELDEEEN